MGKVLKAFLETFNFHPKRGSTAQGCMHVGIILKPLCIESDLKQKKKNFALNGCSGLALRLPTCIKSLIRLRRDNFVTCNIYAKRKKCLSVVVKILFQWIISPVRNYAYGEHENVYKTRGPMVL